MPEAVKKPGRFDKIYQDTQKYEGGFTVDHAGPTNYGITQTTYDSYRKKKSLPLQKVEGIPAEEARSIAEDEYFKGPKFDSFSDPVAEILFDFGFHASPKKATQALQKAVGAKDDGIIGPMTLEATKKFISEHGEKKLMQEIINQRKEHLEGLIKSDPEKYKKYENGWSNRINAIKNKFDLSALNPFAVKDAEAFEIPDIQSGRLDEIEAVSSAPDWDRILDDQFSKTLEDGLSRIEQGKTPAGDGFGAKMASSVMNVISAGMSVKDAEELKGKTLAELKQVPGDIGRSVMFVSGLVATMLKKDADFAVKFFNDPVSAVNDAMNKPFDDSERVADVNEEAFLRTAGRALTPIDRIASMLRASAGGVVSGDGVEKVLQEGMRGFLRPEEIGLGYVGGKIAERAVPQFGDLRDPKSAAFRNSMIAASALAGTVADMITLEIAWGNLGKRMSAWYKNQRTDMIQKDANNFADYAANYMVREGEKNGIFPADWTVADKIGRSKAHVFSLMENNPAFGDFLIKRYTPSRVLFNPKLIIKDSFGQLKWAAENVPFKSNLKAFAYAKLPPKVYGIQAIQTLLNAGMAKEELEFSGVVDWLKGKEGKIDRDEIVDFIEQNKVQVEPVVFDGSKKVPFDGWTEQEIRDHYYQITGDGDASKNYTLDEIKHDISVMEEFSDADRGVNTKYEDYTLPGGENYRETLLTLPEGKDVFDSSKLKITRRRYSTTQGNVELSYDGNSLGTWDDSAGDVSNDFQHPDSYWVAIAKNLFNKGHLPTGMKPLSKSFQSSHWDEPNVLVHHRTNQRTDAQGNKGTFVEEIQSDWHREGKSKGYGIGKALPEGWRVEQPTDKQKADGLGVWTIRDENNYIQYSGKNEADMWTDFNKNKFNKGVPNAPFKNTWHELALKDIIRQAVERGDKFVAFISGQQTADRYDLSKQVDEIRYSPKHSGRLIATKDGKDVIVENNISKDKLADYIGKAAAEKILQSPTVGIGEWHLLSGLDLKLGGEWANKFYDEILPRTAEKYIKKWGGKIEDIKIPIQRLISDIKFEKRYDNNWYSQDEIINIQESKIDGKFRIYDYVQMPPKQIGITDNFQKAQNIAIKHINKIRQQEATQKGFYITPQMEKEVFELGQPLFGPRLAGGLEKLFDQRGTAGAESEPEPLPDDVPERPKIFDEIDWEQPAQESQLLDPTKMSKEEWVEAQGFKVKPPNKIYRGVMESGKGAGTYSLGKGLYSTPDKGYLKGLKFDKILELSADEAFPRNPIVFRNMGNFQDWLLAESGEKNIRRFNEKYKDPADFVKSKGYDGVILEGQEIVKYDNSKTRKQLEAEWEAAKGAAPVAKVESPLAEQPQEAQAQQDPLSYEQDVVKKITEALKEAKPIRGQQETLYTKERGRRMAKAMSVGKRTSGEKGFFSELGQLKGELPKAEFEAIREKLKQEDIDTVFNMVKNNNLLGFWEKITARTGLAKLFGQYGGTVPTKGELALLNKVFGNEFVETLLSKRPFFDQFKDAVNQAVNIPRSVMASFDLSAPMRQGVFFIGRKEFYKAFPKMFKYFGSEKAFKAINEEIASRPSFDLMKESKLALTEMDALLIDREEAFMSNWAEKIPLVGRGIKMSGRAYVGFLNKLRADVFDDLVNKAQGMGLNPYENRDLAKEISTFVNAGTGRGPLGSLERAGVNLNSIFFSPRLIASRLTLLNPVYYAKLSPFVRKEALKSLLSFAGFLSTILGIFALSGADVGTDIRSSDFMKVKIGNTRLDFFGGFQPYMRMMGQLISGKYVSSTTGKVVTLGEGYKPLTRLQIIERQVRSKLSPAASFVVTLLEGQDWKGQKIKVSEEIMNRLTPMVAGDIMDLLDEDPNLLPLGALGIFGVGVQTYGGATKLKRKKRSVK